MLYNNHSCLIEKQSPSNAPMTKTAISRWRVHTEVDDVRRGAELQKSVLQAQYVDGMMGFW